MIARLVKRTFATCFITVACLFFPTGLQGGGEPWPCEPINPTEDLLSEVVFRNLQPPTDAEKKSLAAFQITLEGKGIPDQWTFRLSSNPKNTKGTIRFEENNGRVIAHAHYPSNLWNGAQLKMKQGVLCQAMRDGRHTLGIWSKGNGTLSLELIELGGNKQVASQRVAFLATDKWNFFRSAAISLKSKDTDRICVSIAVYGDVSFAAPEISPVATPDRASELVFYVPFDEGSPEALFSKGPTGVFGASEPSGVVQGIVGDALRIDSKRRITPLGYLRLAMGLQYMHLADALPREEGTLEFWFRPLKESLETKKWDDSPLFTIGPSASTWMWPNSEDIAVYLRKSDGKLVLDYRERERYLCWPNETLVTIQENVNEQNDVISFRIQLTSLKNGII